MTVGIAAICDTPQGMKFVFCADRQVTTFVKYEGMPKIKQFTPKCHFIYSTSDDSIATLIVNNIVVKIGGNDKLTIRELAEIVSKECKAFYEKTVEEDVLSSYNLVHQKLNADPATLAQDAKNAVRSYLYRFTAEFVIFGFDNPLAAHIFSVDERGKIKQHDSSGFETTGAGGDLAFAELTKFPYHPFLKLGAAIVALYFAKREAERVSTVGDVTDMGLLYYATNKHTQENIPRMLVLSRNNPLMNALDKIYDKISSYELKQLRKGTDDVIKQLQSTNPELFSS